MLLFRELYIAENIRLFKFLISLNPKRALPLSKFRIFVSQFLQQAVSTIIIIATASHFLNLNESQREILTFCFLFVFLIMEIVYYYKRSLKQLQELEKKKKRFHLFKLRFNFAIFYFIVNFSIAFTCFALFYPFTV